MYCSSVTTPALFYDQWAGELIVSKCTLVQLSARCLTGWWKNKMQRVSYCPVCIKSNDELVNINKTWLTTDSYQRHCYHGNQIHPPNCWCKVPQPSRTAFNPISHWTLAQKWECVQLSHKLSATSLFPWKSRSRATVGSHGAFGKVSPRPRLMIN